MAKPKALITGASTGLGAAFAVFMAKDYDLVLVARNEERMKSLIATLPDSANHSYIKADLTKKDDLSNVEHSIAAMSSIDILVNNAGFGTVQPFIEADIESESAQIDLNIRALLRLTHAALQKMKLSKKGAIINVASIAGLQPTPYSAVYGATKAFVKNFTLSVSEELRDTQIRMQALCPGFTRTEFQQRAHIDTSRIPEFMWMQANDVVEQSFKALENNHVVFVPGIGNQLAGFLTSLIPEHISAPVMATIVKANLT